MATFGYTQPTFGAPRTAQSALKPVSPVASALAGSSPLTSGLGGAQGFQMLNQPSKVTAYRPPSPVTPQGGAAVTPNRQPLDTAPTPGVYDLNTDPILQQITALAGMNDQMAQAQALKQREQLLLGYGDQGLAQAVLGAGDPTVQAAGQNPTSILHELSMQHERNLRDLTEQLNQANLFYSGDRVLQEQQAAQDYQAQLAGQAGGVNQALDTIASNLAQALAGNQQQVAQGADDAYSRALAAPPPVGGGGAPAGTVGGPPPPGVNPGQQQAAAAYGVAPQPNMSLDQLNALLAAQGQPAQAYPTQFGSGGGPATIGGPGQVAPPDLAAYNRPLATQGQLQSIVDLLLRSGRLS